MARAVGLEAEMVFKTLVCKGASGGYYVFDIPVAENLDLKKAARARGGEVRCHAAPEGAAAAYGLCTRRVQPVGMKKQFPTVFTRRRRAFPRWRFRRERSDTRWCATPRT